MKRREFLKLSTGAVLAAAPMLNFGRVAAAGTVGLHPGEGTGLQPPAYSTRAVDLVHESLVIDMLHQIVYRLDQRDVLKRWLYQPHGFTEADFDAYRRSGINAINFGNGANTYDDAVRLFGEFNGWIAQYPQWLLRIDAASDFALAKSTGRLGVLFGLQNSTHFRTPDDVNTCYGLGQRSSQLTYNFANLIGDGAFETRNAGLTEFGARIVERMNQAGMAVDMAHAGDRTMLDAFALSKKPVIISHGNCRAVNPGHLRCATDEAIRAMARTGGAMGVNFISFMVKPAEPTTVDDAIDHIDHVVKLVGIEHVGIGSDFGLESNDHMSDREAFRKFMAAADKRYRVHAREAVEALDHPMRFYVLTDALLRRGYTAEQIKLILGGNFARVFSTIWT